VIKIIYTERETVLINVVRHINISQSSILSILSTILFVCTYRWKALEAKFNARSCFLDSSVLAKKAE
jgi:hypothetical protein